HLWVKEAFDGKPETRWTPDHPQRRGDTLTLALKPADGTDGHSSAPAEGGRYKSTDAGSKSERASITGWKPVPRAVAKLEFDSKKSPNDWPRGLLAEVSDDLKNWREVGQWTPQAIENLQKDNVFAL